MIQFHRTIYLLVGALALTSYDWARDPSFGASLRRAEPRAGSSPLPGSFTNIVLTITMEANYQVWQTHDTKLWCFVTNVSVPPIVVTVPVTNSPTFWRAKLCALPPPVVTWTTNAP
jgi:hypothetical protein